MSPSTASADAGIDHDHPGDVARKPLGERPAQWSAGVRALGEGCVLTPGKQSVETGFSLRNYGVPGGLAKGFVHGRRPGGYWAEGLACSSRPHRHPRMNPVGAPDPAPWLLCTSTGKTPFPSLSLRPSFSGYMVTYMSNEPKKRRGSITRGRTR